MGDCLLCKKKVGAYKEYLKNNLSKKRYTHSLNVAAAAGKLADLYGGDRDKCYLAGLLHDAAKELSGDKQLELVKKSSLDVSVIETVSAPLFHAIAGAQLIEELFEITDWEILKAVRYHTVGRADMTMTEKIVYLADLISDDRDYKDVKKMRKTAFSDLEKAMYEALKFSVSDSIEKGNTIPVSTIEAYNQYAEKIKQRKD